VHVSSVEAPAVIENMKSLQLMQVLAIESPAVVEYLPAPQSVHVLAIETPIVVRDLQATQSVHESESILVLPHWLHTPSTSCCLLPTTQFLGRCPECHILQALEFDLVCTS
jgi:hypothetical protein